MLNTHSLDLEESSSQYAECADNADVSVTGDISIEVWLKAEQLPSTAGDWFTLVGKFAVDQYSYSFNIVSDDSDKLKFYYFEDAAGSDYTILSSDAAILVAGDVGEWVHLACAVDVSAQTGVLYKNGSPVASGVTTGGTGATSIADTTSDFAIGANQAGGSGFTDGKIDDVRLWDDIRTEAEFADNKDRHILPSSANLAGYWRLNGDYVDLAKSSDLTASGSPVFDDADVPFAGRRVFITHT